MNTMDLTPQQKAVAFINAETATDNPATATIENAFVKEVEDTRFPSNTTRQIVIVRVGHSIHERMEVRLPADEVNRLADEFDRSEVEISLQCLESEGMIIFTNKEGDELSIHHNPRRPNSPFSLFFNGKCIKSTKTLNPIDRMSSRIIEQRGMFLEN